MAGHPSQRGAALVILVAILAIVFVAFMVASAPTAGTATEQEQQTIRALSTAREALLAYAVSVQPDTYAKRPGDLPCPDLDNDGDAEPTCSLLSQRIGRLPVEKLELQDLVDGHGERLWYALSDKFDRSTGNQCPTPANPRCLNSETGGTITVRSPTGTVINDGTSVPSAAIAVIFSAGPAITRQDGVVQDRGCTGDANVAVCQATGRCSDKLGTTARCNPVNYLDAVSGGGLPNEDNKDFADSDPSNGFIQGPIRQSNGNLLVNDRLLVLRYADLMPRLEQRVAREALRCLARYAAANGGHYPWAAPLSSDYTALLSDQSGERFGRLPNLIPLSGGAWPADCPIDRSPGGHEWWANWQKLVFFAIAPGYAPDASVLGCGGTCLAVDPPGTTDKPVVVVVAGRALAGQDRSTSARPSYLEAGNALVTGPFNRMAVSPTFNDVVVF